MEPLRIDFPIGLVLTMGIWRISLGASGDEWCEMGDAVNSASMLLTGTYRRSLDEKLRFAIPKQLREILKDQSLFVAPGTDKAIVVYPENVLEQVGQALSALSPAAKDAKTFARLFYSQAQRGEIDRQGRLRIPPELSALAKLESEVVIVGVRDRLEIWNAQSWDAFIQQSQPSYDELAERVFDEALNSANRP